MTQPKKPGFLKSFLGWFIVFYLILSIVQYFTYTTENKEVTIEKEVQIKLVDKSMNLGNLAQFKIENLASAPLSFASPCEEAGSLKVFRLLNGQEVEVSKFENCESADLPGFTLEPGEDQVLSFAEYNHVFFSESGRYQLEATMQTGDTSKVMRSEIFEYDNPGIFRQLFRGLISKPLFNTLVFFVDKLPTHSFGWAVILLTILVRLLLFAPNQRAIRSQHELQKFQPKIEEIKKKYANNQQMLAMKTMELYKTHKINPMSSCLPMLLQMPFLLGLYFIVRDGLSPHLNFLLYSFQAGIDLSLVQTEFFGLDLGVPNILVLPALVGIAQWVAMKLTFSIQKKRKIGKENKPEKAPAIAGQMQQMNKMMIWVMPLMIAFFTASFPAAVGIYWLTSTLFGIAQQKIVYYQMDKPQVRRVEK